MAQPVYQYSLVKQKQLTLIKQKQESETLLTAEKSSDILRQTAQIKIQHENEVVDLNDQISGLKTSHESELAQYRSEISKLEKEINKRDAVPHPALPDMDEKAREDELKQYDAIILGAIEGLLPGIFRLNGLFGQSHWSAIADDTRGELEERFRSQVERGDIVGVFTWATVKGPQRYMKAKN